MCTRHIHTYTPTYAHTQIHNQEYNISSDAQNSHTIIYPMFSPSHFFVPPSSPPLLFPYLLPPSFSSSPQLSSLLLLLLFSLVLFFLTFLSSFLFNVRIFFLFCFVSLSENVTDSNSEGPWIKQILHFDPVQKTLMAVQTNF